jgi:hypothetical protein
MLLPAIFVPIVHKTSLKLLRVVKNTSNPFKFNQLLILLKIYIYLAYIHKTGNPPGFPIYFRVLSGATRVSLMK